MMRGMFAAISGLKTHQVMLDVTSNDIANVNTIGYKSARTTFKDSLNQIQHSGTASNSAVGGGNPAQVGLGVQLGHRVSSARAPRSGDTSSQAAERGRIT